jgi:hypothetical protein
MDGPAAANRAGRAGDMAALKRRVGCCASICDQAAE